MNSSSENKNRSKGRNRHLWKRFLFAISRKHPHKDFQIAMFLPDKNRDSAIAFPKIDQALNLISQFDPDRYRDVQSDVKRIWVGQSSAYAEWVGSLQMCTLDGEFLFAADLSPAEIASIIVHEATHARLDKAGEEYNFETAARIERICIEAELSFVKLLPDNEELIKNVESRLTTPDSFWSQDATLKRLLGTLDDMGKESKLTRILNAMIKLYVKWKRPHR